ncbi:MAG TPA: phage tail protein [Firmicutes bacterium]|jgi:microcystin-dependent protein|nr:phage tail protein [Bacillota bacterium]
MPDDFYYYGQIVLFPNNSVPQGWLPCDGRQLPLQQYSPLFSLISTKFGGDGKTTFALPNLKGVEPQPGMEYYIYNSGLYPGKWEDK